MHYAHEMEIVNNSWSVPVWRMEHDNVNVKHNFSMIMNEDDAVSIW